MTRDSERLEKAPPRAIRFLEKTLGRHPAGAAMLGDLLEGFHDVVQESGSRRARYWFWLQAIRLVIGFSLFRLFRPIERWWESPRTRRTLESLAPLGWLVDLRYALRSLRKDKGLVVFSTLVTGLGIGATTAVFSVMNPLLFQPLPFAEPEELVWISNQPDGGLSAITSRPQNLLDYREMATSFEALGAYDAFFQQHSYTLTGEGEPERLSGVGVTANFLPVLGVEPALGRHFTAEEGRQREDAAILLAHSSWQQRFGGRRDIVGEALTINGRPSTVIGVLPETFDFASIFAPSTRVDLLTIFPISAETDVWGNSLSIIGRLKEGVDLEEATAEVALILERLQEADPERWGLGAHLESLSEAISGDHRLALLLLFGAAAAILLIVCVNLSSLLLSKGIRRRQEMYLRAALGAPAGRLLRLMLLESLILAACGALVGIALAVLITYSVANGSSVAIPLLRNVRVDLWALVFSCVASLGSGLVIGILPALQASGTGAAGALKAAGRTLTASRKSRFLRESLVVAEVALACALLIVGALLLQSFGNILQVDLGFEFTELVAWQIDTERDFESAAESAVFFSEVAERVRAVPGVEAVGLTDAIPLGINRQWSLSIVGQERESGELIEMYPHLVDRHYLDTMGISLLRGRHFSATDTVASEVVGIINESAAQSLFPGEDPVGKSLQGALKIKIIGVCADVKHLDLEAGAGYELYLPMSQVGDYSSVDLVVRTAMRVEAIQEGVAAAMQGVDGSIPTNAFRTLNSVVIGSISPRRFTLTLLTAFGGTALLLAAIGIYGVLSYTVAERSREIAIRMALGESAKQIRRRILVRTLALALFGAVVGIGLSLLCSPFISSMLFGVEATHLGTLIMIPSILLFVAAISGLQPAWRASQVDGLAILQKTT